MAARLPLTEREKYLVAILQDRSGIDLCEFARNEPKNPDGCWRAWPHQWSWYRNRAHHQAYNTSRAAGKSEGIACRTLAMPFAQRGKEMLLAAPELKHLDRLTAVIEQHIRGTRLFREMLPRGRSDGIKHAPMFTVSWANGTKLFARIAGEDGRGVKSMHVTNLIIDEAQDFPEKGWIEITEVLERGDPDHLYIVSGVPRGGRDRFYEIIEQPGPHNPFFVHKYPAMYKPTWTPQEREEKITMYGGSEEAVDYLRNVFGKSGDASNLFFVTHRLMACVRFTTESKWSMEYNENVYWKKKINDELMRAQQAPIEFYLEDIPATHLDKCYYAYWAGLDYGATRDPSELLVFGEMEKDGKPFLRLLTRFHMMRVTPQDQAGAVKNIFEFYGKRLQALAMDSTGIGLPLWQMLNPEAAGMHTTNLQTPKWVMERIKGFGFSQKIIMDFEKRELERGEIPEDLAIEKVVVDAGYDELRMLVDSGRLELPYDREILSEMQGVEVAYVKDGGSTSKFARRMKAGGLHSTDAMILAALARQQTPIQAQLALPPQEDRVPLFGF
jgi:hypothetical protein